MSSLRLALKQSLQESGGLQISSSERRKKKNRHLMKMTDRDEDHDDTSEEHVDDDVSNNDSHSSHNNSRMRNKNKRDWKKQLDCDSSRSSEENEFSAAERNEEEGDCDDENEDHSQRKEREEEDEEDESANSDDDDENDSSSCERKAQQHHRKVSSPDSQQDEQYRKQHSAAHKIQSQWKAKKESVPPEDDDEAHEGEGDEEHDKHYLKKQAATHSSPETHHSDRKNNVDEKHKPGKKKEQESPGKQRPNKDSTARNKQTLNKKDRSTKAMTVAPPDPAIIEWMTNMPVKRCRRSIVPGIRVKVRFATKVAVRRKETDPDDPNQTIIQKQIVRKKKWFGGRVSAVSKEGSKIRIKYDDGTSEVTKFPDKDVIVDDTANGQHQVPADSFRPPPKAPSPPLSPRSPSVSPGSPAIVSRKTAPVSNVSMTTGCDLIDTPMQQVSTPQTKKNLESLDLKLAPKLILPSPRRKGQQQNRRQQHEEDEHQDDSAPNANVAIPQEKPTEQAITSTEEAPGPESKLTSQCEQSQDEPAIELEYKSSPVAANELETKNELPFVKSEQVLASPRKDESIIGNRIYISSSNIALATSDSFHHDDASVDDPNDNSAHLKRKRGRPPKHRFGSASEESSPVHVPKEISQPNTTEFVAAVEDKLFQADRPVQEKPNKPTLKIRIATNKIGDKQSPRQVKPVLEGQSFPQMSNVEEMEELQPDGRQGKKKKQRHIDDHEMVDPAEREKPSKKIHIVISSQQLPISPPDTTAVTETVTKSGSHEIETFESPKQKKRKFDLTEGTSTSLLPSPTLSPHQRKKKKLKLSAAGSADEAEIGSLLVGMKSSLDQQPPSTSDANTIIKAIRIKKSSSTAAADVPSAMENPSSVGDGNTSDSKPGTPNYIPSLKKQDSLSLQDAPTGMRPGRRAAQQANERISSKQDVVITAIDNTNQQTASSNAVKTGKKKKNKEGLEKGGDSVTTKDYVVDMLEDSQWVQCDKCKKWRVIPSNIVDTLPNQWFCSDNIYDPKRASCDAPEQTAKQVAKERKKKLKRQQRMMLLSEGGGEGLDVPITSSSSNIKEQQNKESTTNKEATTKDSKEKPKTASNKEPTAKDSKEKPKTSTNKEATTKDSKEKPKTTNNKEPTTKESKEKPKTTTNKEPTAKDSKEKPKNTSSKEPTPKDSKEKPAERAGTPQPLCQEENQPAFPTLAKSSKRYSPSIETSSNVAFSESGSDTQALGTKQERRMSTMGKKQMKQSLQTASALSEPFDNRTASEQADNRTASITSDTGGMPRRGRGRPRRNQGKDFLPVECNSTNDGNKIEDDNLEWVQCEKCEKWRRLPSHISADDLPDSWYCEMNTWNPESASCDVPEDKADGMQDIGGIGGTGGMANKLTYRNLIFGSTGRKLNRPVSEKARAAESLFSIHLDEEDAPSRVLYADSGAFISRGRPNLLSDENETMSVFETMGSSYLWNELRNAAASLATTDHGILGKYDKAPRLSAYTFDSLPPDVVQPMKDTILYFLKDLTLTGEEILERGKTVTVDNLSSDFEKARQFWTINVVVTTISELVKEGLVECVQKRPSSSSASDTMTVDPYCPYYRRTVSSSNRSTISNESNDDSEHHRQQHQHQAAHFSRCMKISKPWKRKTTPIINDF